MRENPVHSPFKITIGGIDELVDHSNANVTHVLSILDPTTPEPDAFGEFGEHARLELRFHDVIEEFVPGYDAPQPHHIEALLAFGRDLMREPEGQAHLLVHCHMGISRSTAAAFITLCTVRPERDEGEMAQMLRRASSIATPNPIAVYAASARLTDAKFSIASRSVISNTMFAGVRPAAVIRLPTSTSMNAES